MQYTIVDTPLGPFLLAGKPLQFASFQDRPGAIAPEADWVRDDEAFASEAAQLAEYFSGNRRSFDVPLAMDGTSFQLMVWDELQEVPYGQTVTYGQLAERLESSARAVGRANGTNPLPIFVPCHRVVGAVGKLVGYRGGVDLKRFLLALEDQQQSLF